MNRRTLFKRIGCAFLGWSAIKNLAKGRDPRNRQPFRMVVFGADGLRFDTALQLQAEGSPGLASLRPAMGAFSGGSLSVTQPEWAGAWSGLPCYFHNSYANHIYFGMRKNYHVLGRLMDESAARDFFALWITGKGTNIKGNVPESPHYQVYDSIVLSGFPGVYHGDQERENQEVFDLAADALTEAAGHESFCGFIHFRDPDHTGHATENFGQYLRSAREVDALIYQLMHLLPENTDVLYCSDHGFNFVSLGEVENDHLYAPNGMLAANFPTRRPGTVTRQSIARLIYKRSGGNPDFCSGDPPYAMYGIDL